MDSVIGLKTRTREKINVTAAKAHQNDTSPSKRAALRKIREDALNSETIWMHSVEFPAAIRGKVVPVIDWQVFQMRAVLGI